MIVALLFILSFCAIFIVACSFHAFHAANIEERIFFTFMAIALVVLAILFCYAHIYGVCVR